MTSRARSLATAIATVLLVAAWLRFAPAPVGAALGGMAGAIGEAAFALAVFGPLILLAAGAGRIAGVAALAPGRDAGRSAGLGAVLGLAGLLLAVGYAALAGTLAVRGGVIGAGLALGVLAVLVQVVAEEAVFRGMLQPLAVRAVGPGLAVAGVAVLFAALHRLAGPLAPLTFVNLLLGGVLFGVLALRGAGLAGAVAAHGAWNGGEQLLLGLDPNPGTGAFGALVDLDLHGAAAWGGSAEGLNASWAMTIALAALVVPLVLRRPQVADAARPASMRSR